MHAKQSIAIAVALFAATALVSRAGTYTEAGDAGQSLTTATVLPGGTNTVVGTVTSSDADLFKFGWGGGGFYANTVGSNFDSQLFLFSASGVGIQGNDDGIAYAGPAYLQLASLAAGQYFIGVSGYDLDPYSAGGLMFQSYPYEPLYPPLNSNPLSSWGGGGQPGTYYINFQKITDTGDPISDNPTVGTVPDAASSLGLLGIAFVTLASVRRRLNK